MDRSRQRAGVRGIFLLVLACVAAVGPSWASTYLCPMARAEAPKASCCAHKVPKSGTFSVSLREACHCPIPAWQAGAADQERIAPQIEASLLAAPVPGLLTVGTFAAPRTLPISAAVPTGPPLWVRNQAILC